MANGIVTFKVMPESPEIDVESIKEKMLEIAKKHGSKGEMQSKVEPLAFGLKAIIVMALYEMSDDMDFDTVKDEMAKIEGASTAEIVNMDLAMG